MMVLGPAVGLGSVPFMEKNACPAEEESATACPGESCRAFACPHGVGIREAFLLAKTAQAFRADITLAHEGFRADAKSLLAILGLGIRSGGTVAVSVRGADVAAALAGMEALLACPGPSVFTPAPIPGPESLPPASPPPQV